ncbi:MAG: hypothetical protein SFV54_22795 [Bryobacteraceae bacterium]|nr:hypothetical protein [Bryobacteraceae bacterium]
MLTTIFRSGKVAAGLSLIVLLPTSGVSGAEPPRIREIGSAAVATDKIAPCGWGSIYGEGLASKTVEAQAPFPDTLDGVVVRLNGQRTPLHFVSTSQINFQVPCTMPPGPATVSVSHAGGSTMAQTSVEQMAPSIFMYRASNTLLAAVQRHPDYKLIGLGQYDSVPARPGNILIVYGTGFSLPKTPTTGAPPGEAIPIPNVSASIDGNPVKVLGAATSPYLVGLEQVAIEVPQMTTGIKSLRIAQGGIESAAASLPVVEHDNYYTATVEPTDGKEVIFSGKITNPNGQDQWFKATNNNILTNIPGGKTDKLTLELIHNDYVPWKATVNSTSGQEYRVLPVLSDPELKVRFLENAQLQVGSIDPSTYLFTPDETKSFSLLDMIRYKGKFGGNYPIVEHWHPPGPIKAYIDPTGIAPEKMEAIREALRYWDTPTQKHFVEVNYDPTTRSGETGIRIKHGIRNFAQSIYTPDREDAMEISIDTRLSPYILYRNGAHEIGHTLLLPHTPAYFAEQDNLTKKAKEYVMHSSMSLERSATPQPILAQTVRIMRSGKPLDMRPHLLGIGEPSATPMTEGQAERLAEGTVKQYMSGTAQGFCDGYRVPLKARTSSYLY